MEAVAAEARRDAACSCGTPAARSAAASASTRSVRVMAVDSMAMC
jgi:hypothetical protein